MNKNPTLPNRFASLLAAVAYLACATASGQELFAPPGADALPDPVRVARTCGVSSGFQPAVGRFGAFAPPPIASSIVGPCDAQACTPCLEAPLPEPEHHPVQVDCRAYQTPCSTGDFSADAYFPQPYCAPQELDIYNGKYEIWTQRPWVECGLPFYDAGPIPVSGTRLGVTNLTQPKFYLYGDYRVAFAQNELVRGDKTVLAHRLNLEADLWITSTERFHAFFGPFQEDADFMRVEEGKFFEELDFFQGDTDTFFFEGDLGQIYGGLSGQYAPIDLPVTAGLVPLLFQNGVGALDAIVGGAMTIPAQNSPMLDWSNYDVTFFAGFDRVTTGALDFADDAGAVFGVTTFIESRGGYLELGYGFVDDQAGLDRSYHNLAMSYTRRYANTISNSVRVIVNTGQDRDGVRQTADGVLLLVENALLSRDAYHTIPYLNFFAGFDRPQPLVRAGAFGGVLFNTGILFQSDQLTGYPTLDGSGNNTWGAALGVELLTPGYDQQLFVEVAALGVMGPAADRAAAGDQVGLGVRWQKKLSTATLVRADAMVGWLDNSEDIAGARVEYRWKF